VKQHNLLKAATAALAIFVFGVQSASANWIVTQNSGTGTSSSVSGTLSGTGPTVYNNTLYDSKNWTKAWQWQGQGNSGRWTVTANATGQAAANSSINRCNTASADSHASWSHSQSVTYPGGGSTSYSATEFLSDVACSSPPTCDNSAGPTPHNHPWTQTDAVTWSLTVTVSTRVNMRIDVARGSTGSAGGSASASAAIPNGPTQ
jgi:hypothetical protein